MFETKDYSLSTRQELMTEEAKNKKQQKTVYIVAGLAVGITLYAIFKKSVSFIHVALPFMCAFMMHKNGENLKLIQAAMQNKQNNENE